MAVLARCASRIGNLLLLVCLGLIAVPGQGAAQQLGVPTSAILTIESDRLFALTAFGRRVATEIEADSAVLAAENRRIEAELSAEEQELTLRRSEMEPEAFRALADAFDQKVRTTRNTQDAKTRALKQRGDQARGEFLRAVRPVLEAMMREAGASVIMERSNVFLSANSTNITDLAIARIDAAIGSGVRPDPDQD